MFYYAYYAEWANHFAPLYSNADYNNHDQAPVFETNIS